MTEKINLNNYEAFFLDYVEGNLSDEQKVELNDFLIQNPHLRAELDDFDPVYLEAEKKSDPNLGNMLKRDESTSLLKEDYLMIVQVEDVITKEEKAQLAELIEKRPALLNTLSVYHKTRLKEEKLLFPFKADLYRKEKSVFGWIKYASAAAAAVLAILVWNSDPEKVYTPRESVYVQTEQVDSSEKESFAFIVEKKEVVRSEEKSELAVKSKKPELKNTGLASEHKKKAVKIRETETLDKVETSLANQEDINQPEDKEIEKEQTPEIKIPDDNLVAENQEEPKSVPEADNYIPVKEYAKQKIKKDLLKGKTFSETILEEIAEVSNEKVSFEREKNNKGKTEGFAINIGKFSISKNK